MWHLFNFLLTTLYHVDNQSLACNELLLLPQRYVFSSKSQRLWCRTNQDKCCYCYHKGTYFQANHNLEKKTGNIVWVVIATTKVRIFKQITTTLHLPPHEGQLLLLPQRYVFSSKSQPSYISVNSVARCYCYHKGTYFQANHNVETDYTYKIGVVIATTKVRIFKQITTVNFVLQNHSVLLLLPQRYVFSSKSQLCWVKGYQMRCCYCYHKGTYFQANHNTR